GTGDVPNRRRRSLDVARQCDRGRRRGADPVGPVDTGYRPGAVGGADGGCLDIHRQAAGTGVLARLGRARHHHLCRFADDLGRLVGDPAPKRRAEPCRAVSAGCRPGKGRGPAVSIVSGAASWTTGCPGMMAKIDRTLKRPRPYSTICVCVTSATSLPSAVVTRVCQTWV